MDELWLKNVDCEGIGKRAAEKKCACENDMFVDEYSVTVATMEDGRDAEGGTEGKHE